jgi:hypothetical protein
MTSSIFHQLLNFFRGDSIDLRGVDDEIKFLLKNLPIKLELMVTLEEGFVDHVFVLSDEGLVELFRGLDTHSIFLFINQSKTREVLRIDDKEERGFRSSSRGEGRRRKESR